MCTYTRYCVIPAIGRFAIAQSYQQCRMPVIDYHSNHGNGASSGYITADLSHIFRYIGVHTHPILRYSCRSALAIAQSYKQCRMPVIDYHSNHGNGVSSGYIAVVLSHIFMCICVHIHPILLYSCNSALAFAKSY